MAHTCIPGFQLSVEGNKGQKTVFKKNAGTRMGEKVIQNIKRIQQQQKGNGDYQNLKLATGLHRSPKKNTKNGQQNKERSSTSLATEK